MVVADFIGNIYQFFNNKKYLVVIFNVKCGAFNTVNILLLLPCLQSLNLPSRFTSFISQLFSRRILHFFSPFGSTNIRSTSTGLPQGSCLCTIICNIYICFIINHFNPIGHKCSVYADDIVIFYYNEHTAFIVNSLNNALSSSHNVPFSSFLFIAPKKCKSLIFPRLCYHNLPPKIINGYTIPFESNHMYLDLNKDTDLR